MSNLEHKHSQTAAGRGGAEGARGRNETQTNVKEDQKEADGDRTAVPEIGQERRLISADGASGRREETGGDADQRKRKT